MKFNALVVAAMVITSVSASGKGRPRGFLKKGGGMTGSESLEKLVIEDDSESEPPQDSQRHGATQRLSWSSMGQSLGSVFSSKSSRNKPSTPQNPVCISIEDELCTFWDKVYDLNCEFQKQLPLFYRIMMMEEGKNKKGNKGKRGKEEEKINLKDEQIRACLEFNPEAIPDLQGFKAKYDSLEKERDDILKRFDENECPKTFKQLSLKEITKQGNFPKWYDENDVNFLGDQ
ncbi:hypothetical protein BASA61_005874 [Batrachochytrium salamandrivorans]|nr:hypothetical protein BASA60_000805 [Batrachochytrium salamandrivorans]KAH6588601.1 hypothetical protein BASA61_005874 [Batrachochytrium salamandrivorans]KAH9275619.1 hypothetical protein BASA83_001906 [Batrachochytrium salamandrivorans]